MLGKKSSRTMIGPISGGWRGRKRRPNMPFAKEKTLDDIRT
jgi:hypothetical protein